MKLPERKEVPVELTWDLSHLYATEEELSADRAAVREMSSRIVEEYRGRLDTPERINACLDEWQALMEKMDHIGNYCNLSVAVDYTDAKSQERQAAVRAEQAEIMSALSFIESELSEAEESLIEGAIAIATSNRHYLEEILRGKPHRLGPEAEAVLARLGTTLDAPYELYHIVKLADMQFAPFVVDGEEYPLGYSLFEDDYEYDERTGVRRGAFRAFSDELAAYQNITGAIYNTHVQKEKTLASLRGFDSVIDSILFGQKVSREIYERQIDTIMERLAPHMRRYADLIKRVHHLDKMTYADLKLTVDPDYAPQITIAEAEEFLAAGLSPLGADYVDMVHEAFRDRWVDFAQNIGKETGGFCSSPYRKHSYILLTWHDHMSDVMTLAHELGHAGHFRLCGEAQSWFDTNDQDFIIEAPSTANEIIMAHHLLKTNPDKRFQRWVRSSMISKTYYHNFVTHLLEAAYQREVYRIVDAGGSVQAETLNRIMRETLEKFWGDTVELTEGAELTWMRQPHYYMGLYSYVYSAGLTIGTQVSKRIEEEGEPAVEAWKAAMRAGGTLTPAQFAAAAGVDLSSEQPLLDTIEYIGELIDDVIRLTEELDAG